MNKIFFYLLTNTNDLQISVIDCLKVIKGLIKKFFTIDLVLVQGYVFKCLLCFELKRLTLKCSIRFLK